MLASLYRCYNHKVLAAVLKSKAESRGQAGTNRKNRQNQANLVTFHQTTDLLRSPAKKGAFGDANNRLTFTLTAIFLGMNSFQNEGRADLEEITGWIESQMRKAKP
jgi:prophage maintenance system killer protein